MIGRFVGALILVVLVADVDRPAAFVRFTVLFLDLVSIYVLIRIRLCSSFEILDKRTDADPVQDDRKPDGHYDACKQFFPAGDVVFFEDE